MVGSSELTEPRLVNVIRAEDTWVEEATILRAVVGSTVHGLALAGTDDHDEMGVCIEPPERVVGLNHFEQFIYRTAEDRARYDPEADQRYAGKTPPSQAGDTDLVVYSLRKFARLAAAGNPSILVLLYAPPLVATPLGEELQASASMFASRQAGMRFLGYLKAQRERMLGTRGQMRVTRTELIEKHGYDTKYAMHMVRLGFQGREFLTFGKLSLPPDASNVDMAYCMKIRKGRVPFQEILDVTETLENDIKGLIETSSLPKRPDHKAIDRFLVKAYTSTWATRSYVPHPTLGRTHLKREKPQ